MSMLDNMIKIYATGKIWKTTIIARNSKIRLFNACIKSENWNATQGDYICLNRQHISADNSKGLLVQHDFKQNDMKIIWDIYFVIEIHKTIKMSWTFPIYVKNFKWFIDTLRENCSHMCLKWCHMVSIVHISVMEKLLLLYFF